MTVAQVSTLATMAFCYFLAPHFAWAYSIVAIGWFLVLAVPQATAWPHGVAGERLMAASVGRQYLPGGGRFTVQVAGRYVTVFGWPAVVAVILPPPAGSRSAEPMVILVCLIFLAAALVGVVALAGPRRKELARYTMFAIGALAMATAVVLPGFPGLPQQAVGQPE